MVAVTAAVRDTVAAAVVVAVTATVTGTIMATVVVPILDPIAASHAAILVATLRRQTRRQSRQYCGVKHGVDRDNISASNTASIVISSLPHRDVNCGSVAASSTTSVAAILRRQTWRQSRQDRGFKYGVNRDLIAASSRRQIRRQCGRDRGRRFPFSVRRRLGRTTVRFLAGSGWSRACGWRGRQGGFWPRTRRWRVLRPDLPRP